MRESHSSDKNRLLDYLHAATAYSTVEEGLRLAQDGCVKECSKNAHGVTGLVRFNDNEWDVHVEIASYREFHPHCSCPSAAQKESWCAHSVAVLWRAQELGFFAPHSGFAARDSTYRVHRTSPADIAQVIRDVSNPAALELTSRSITPHVTISLDVASDRLGVQILFDDEVQEPSVLAGLAQTSTRALDNLLLQILEDEGAWDEEQKRWYVNSSHGIGVVLGLLREYSQIISGSNHRPISISTELVNARLSITWLKSGAELTMAWCLPNGSIDPEHHELLGSGPFWVAIDNTIFPVSTEAARIASIFPYSSQMTITRAGIGPVLESLAGGLINTSIIEIREPQLQPKTEIKTPRPVLEIQRIEHEAEHFSSSSGFELRASLQFEYPTPPNEKNIVYLPDREKEREYAEFLESLGFEFHAERKSYTCSAHAALDFIHSGYRQLPDEWQVEGLDAIRKSIRFADIALDVSLSASGDLLADELMSKRTSAKDPAHKRKSAKSGGPFAPIDWFDCHISLVVNNANVPISTLFKSSRSDSDRWVRLESGAFARVPGGSLSQLKATLGLVDPNFRLSNSIKTKLSTAQAIGFSRLTDPHVNVEVDTHLKRLSKQLDNFEKLKPARPPRNFSGKLRPYQSEGLAWLLFLKDLKFGGILADEMGLGKTVQTLALIQTIKDLCAKNKRTFKPALVIAPTSVLMNWRYEAQRFTPKLKAMVLHGVGRKTAFKAIPEHDLVITSYALLRLDRYELERFSFSYLILDEAQHIKNYQAATTQAAKSLKADYRLALSGTPTENRPLELWSLMDFLMPGYLGGYEFFRNHIEKPILELGPNVPAAKLLRAKTKPFILRRTKAEVAKELPAKVESVLHVPMTPSQQELYSHILEEVRPRVFDAVEKKGIAGASVSILAALLRLRQVCNHPNSIESLKDVPGYDSGKFSVLIELLAEALEAGRKVLLFGQFREMLAIIRRHLEERNVKYLYLDGSTRNRQELIDRFNEDERIRLFLISLKAGGLGLNLTAADMVIIYDPWWNPAVENQAVDRAHRIGQRKTVNVYRLVTENSVEQKIMDLKKKKDAIVSALIQEGALTPLSLSRTDLEALFQPLASTERTSEADW